VVVALPRDLRDALQTLAARDGRDEGAVVRDALRNYLGSASMPEAPVFHSLGIISDADLQSESYEDWSLTPPSVEGDQQKR
jgi:plasmid stability protein